MQHSALLWGWKVAVKGGWDPTLHSEGPSKLYLQGCHRMKLQATLKAERARGTIREAESKAHRLQQFRKRMRRHFRDCIKKRPQNFKERSSGSREETVDIKKRVQRLFYCFYNMDNHKAGGNGSVCQTGEFEKER